MACRGMEPVAMSRRRDSPTVARTGRSIELHQLLHGYDGGHRRLAGSIELPREVDHALLKLSDMSGPTFVRGFDRYLTGYPLSADYYAFARTWYAPEMP